MWQGAAAQLEQLAVRGGERGFEGGKLLAAAALLVGALGSEPRLIALVESVGGFAGIRRG